MSHHTLQTIEVPGKQIEERPVICRIFFRQQRLTLCILLARLMVTFGV